MGIVTMQDVKTHLRYPATDTVDDAALQGFIDAAGEVIRSECDFVVPEQFDESYDGGDLAIFTWNKPILSVERVEEGWGYINYELDFVEVNSPPGNLSMFAYSIDNLDTGIISRRTAGNINIPFMRGNSNIRITYTAGRAKVPKAIRLAALELIAHWWQNSQMRSSGMNLQFDTTDQDFTRSQGLTSFNQGVPYRILEMLKPWRREPVIG